MALVRVGDRALPTRFAVPSGRAADVLATLEAQGVGLARARVASRLGDPDPFPLRAALAASPDAAVTGAEGDVLSADAVDALLLAADAACDPALAGLFAGRPPGPLARAVPVDDPRRPWLRWPARPAPPARVGKVETWTTAEIGDTPVATVRCAEPLPGGGVALGSDYGLTLWQNGAFQPFPWPRGSRREARRVEAMAVSGGRLWIATTQALYDWDFAAKVGNRRHGEDEEGGYDDLTAMLSTGDRLLLGYRTRFEGASGPRDVLAMARDPSGVVYAGTRHGELHVIDACGPVRVFADSKPRPVRHVAFAQGALWVASAGALHRFDGAAWSSSTPEPTALAVDRHDRLWALAEGGLHLLDGGALRPVPVALERPWSLATTPGALWIGGRERVWRVAVA